MTRPLDDIEFLSRSRNRVTVLEALSARPQSRAELEASTGVSKVTVGRVLEAFFERGWISHAGDQYRTTPTGDAIATDFSRLQTTVGTARKLRPVARYLSVLRFDVRHLEDARVTLPDPNDPMAPFERPIDLLRGADRLRFLSRMVSPVVLELIRDAVVDGGGTVEAVVSEGAVDRIRSDRELTALAREVLASDRVVAHRFEGPAPLEVAEVDGTVAILITDEDDVPRAFVETTDEAVREWFDAEFESHRERAEPLRVADVAGDDDTS